MVQIIDFLSKLNMTFITFLLVELLLSLMFTKDWKFRFKRAKNYPNLRPNSKSWKITWAFLMFTFIISPFVITGLWFFLPALLIKIGWNQFFVLLGVAPMVYLWAKLKIISKTGISWWDSIPILISVISAALFFYFIFK